MPLSGKLLAMIAIIWLFGVLMGSTFNYQNTANTWAGTSTGNSYSQSGYGQVSDLDYLLNIKNATQQIPFLGGLSIPIPNPAYFVVLGSVLTLQFPFLMTNAIGSIFWFIFLMPFSLMGIYGLISTLYNMVRGNISWGT